MNIRNIYEAKLDYFISKLESAEAALDYSKNNRAQEDLTEKYEKEVKLCKRECREYQHQIEEHKA